MPLIIEDGSIVAGADSYISLADARTLAAAYGLALPVDDTAAEVALRNGVFYADSYEASLKGCRVSDSQSLAWPRSGVYRFGFLLANNTVPEDVKRAQVFAAVEIAAKGDAWGTDDGKSVASEAVSGAVSVSYFNTGKSGTSYKIKRADNAMLPLLASGAAQLSVGRGGYGY